MSKLRSWQEASAARLLEILRAGGNAVDLSDTGTGKTAHAAHVIAELKLPTLVIAPKISLTSWRRMLEHFGTSASIINWEALTMGKSPYGAWQKPAERGKYFFLCANCLCKFSSEEKPTRCSSHFAGVHCFVRKSVKQKRGRWTWASQVRFVVADECQRAGAMRSLNAELIVAARRQNIRTLGLSATLATSPLGLRAWGYALDLFPNPDAAFYSWSRRHGCGRIPALPGWRWLAGVERQKEIMASINADLIPARGVRVRTEDIPNFPERQIIPQLYDIPNPDKLDAAYAEATPEHPLTEILRARQRAELLKLDLLVELATDEMAKGNSVAVFCNFTATLDALRERLRCDCFVSGSPEGVSERDNNIARFQRNENRLILLNSAAGGVAINLQDLHGGHPRVGLVSPSFSATEFRQVCGRLHRAGGKSRCLYRVVLVANSVEEKVYRALKQKESNLDALNTSDLDFISSD